jgi:hypothetical protein
VPIGGSSHEAKKNVYFTNIYAEEEDTGYAVMNAKNRIENITYINAQNPETFASGELPTYKSAFNTLPYSAKKIFNWTNPAMINSSSYETFRGESSGSDENTASNAWKKQTMTSYDSDSIAWKTNASFVESDD